MVNGAILIWEKSTKHVRIKKVSRIIEEKHCTKDTQHVLLGFRVEMWMKNWEKKMRESENVLPLYGRSISPILVRKEKLSCI